MGGRKLSSKQTLSKTDFLDFLDNPKHLWANKNYPDTLSPLDDFTRHQLEQGNEVQVLAKKYFRNQLFKDKSKFEVKTEYSFANGPLVTRVDVLVHDLQSDVYDVYEIKGSTNSNEKKKHKLDISFQAQVIEDQIRVRDFFLLRLNAEYVRKGEIDPDELFVIDSMNGAVEEMRGEVTALIDKALSAMNAESADHLESCFKPATCPCPSICHPNMPEYSIYELSRLSKKKAIILRGQNIDQIQNIPVEMELSERQSLQRMSVMEAQALIEHESLREFLSKLEYPLHFLDYETLGLALPVYDGYKPYQNMVFQYSLHVQQEKGGALEHFEYLATEDEDPGAGLVKDLVQHVKERGSMIVWNQGFEIGRNKEMAEMYPDYKDMLLSLNERSFDLMKAFSQTSYIHPDFAGSASLKKVLPALLPDLGRQYEEMDVSNGAMAMIAWKDLIWGQNSEPVREKIKQDLLAYCMLDTSAMVEILDLLYAL
jgi:hypothetical protein